MEIPTGPVCSTRTFIRNFAIAALCLLASACNSASDGSGQGAAAPEVAYRVMRPTTVPIVIELPGRVNALRTAEVRPQITGVILRQLFREGAMVRKGQPLYQIDPSLYQAAVDQASANLASAQATAAASRAKADRYRPLAAEQAVAQQDYTDAEASARQARAAVAQNRAALQAAKVNLRFTRVPAPITGRIGRSLFTEGALVTDSQESPLAVISVLDPIYVDIQQSSSELLALRRRLAGSGTAPLSADARLTLEDGSDYGVVGTVEFSEVTVNPSTGTVTLRARFPNPQNVLLPGMFVRARFAQVNETNAFLVPQIALTRDAKGDAEVYVLGKDNKVERRTVKAEHTRGSDWIVTGGLSSGDRVILHGLGRVKPGDTAKPVPETPPRTGPKTSGQESDAAGKPG